MGSGEYKSGSARALLSDFPRSKTNGRVRLIKDMSKLNSSLIQGFKIETVAKIRKAIQPNDWAFTLDLTDAYLHVPIHKACFRTLRFCLQDHVFQFRALSSDCPRVRSSSLS